MKQHDRSAPIIIFPTGTFTNWNRHLQLEGQNIQLIPDFTGMVFDRIFQCYMHFIVINVFEFKKYICLMSNDMQSKK